MKFRKFVIYVKKNLVLIIKIKNIKSEAIVIIQENIEEQLIITNLRYKIPKKIPVVFHNGSTYNSFYNSVFQTQIISRRQKNADTKVALLISRGQKWKSRRQFSKNCIFPNIQLKGVANKLLQFKNLFDHTNRF